MTSQSIETLLDATRLAALETTRGGRILAKVSSPDAKGTSYRSALVEIDGERLVPLTRGSASVGAVAEAEDAQLWALPVRGEARELAARPGGFGGLTVAGRHLVAELKVHSQAADEAEHRELSSQRKDAKVTAALHAGFPTRYWDHDLGPTRPVLAIAALPDDLASAERTAAPAKGPPADGGSGPDDAAGTDEDAPTQVL